MLSVTDDVGVRTVMQELLSASQSLTASECWSAVAILHTFCEKTSADYADYLPQLFRGLIGLFTNSSERVLHAAWDCLNAVTKVSMCCVYKMLKLNMQAHVLYFLFMNGHLLNLDILIHV